MGIVFFLVGRQEQERGWDALPKHTQMASSSPGPAAAPTSASTSRFIVEVEDTAGLWPHVQKVKRKKGRTPPIAFRCTCADPHARLSLYRALQDVSALAPFRDFVLTNKFGNAIDVGDLDVR